MSSDPTTPAEAHLKLAVELLIDSGKQIQSWMTRFTALQGALLTAVGLIVGWAKFDQYTNTLLFVLGGICMFGVITSYLIAGVTLRQIKWNRRYRDRIRALQQLAIMPEESDVRGGSYNQDFVTAMQYLTPLLWIVLGVAIAITAR